MKKATIDKINEMTSAAEDWLSDHDYHFAECNYVPERLFTNNRKLNLALRTFFRLCPVNLRSKTDMAKTPYAPHASVAMLKAFGLAEDGTKAEMIEHRVFDKLQSPKTVNFSLRQGIKIALNLYEDSAEDPTPLNTVWFGEFLLDYRSNDKAANETVHSICRYLIDELGYKDFGEDGIYFYYGHHMKNIIYNASAVFSAFLIRCGLKYNVDEYMTLGRRGIRFIVNNQNVDGSWFYYGPPMKKAIDGFHQSYILKALIDAATADKTLNIDDNIALGEKFYRGQFTHKNGLIHPQRYDKRFNPKNTWLAQKVDGRDVSEALSFFSIYRKDEKMAEGLIDYMYQKIYDRKKRKLAADIFIYGRNRNDYIEFYAWYLYSLYCAKKAFDIA